MSVLLQALHKAASSNSPLPTVSSSPSKKRSLPKISQHPWGVVALVLNLLILTAIVFDLLPLFQSLIGTEIAKKNTVALVAGAEAVAVRPSVTQEWGDWHLFGQPSTPTVPLVPTVVVPEDAPDTQLHLTLTGVLSVAGGRSWATVQSEREGEKTYAIGELIDGISKVVSIYSDRVILEKGGHFETLRLPKSVVSLHSGVPASSGQSGVTLQKSAGASAAQILTQLRKRFLVRPAEVFAKFAVTPVMENGVFVGYTIDSGSEKGLLEQLGLVPGDVVVELNGVVLSAPIKGMEALGTLGKKKSLHLTLLRQGERVTVHHTVLP